MSARLFFDQQIATVKTKEVIVIDCEFCDTGQMYPTAKHLPSICDHHVLIPLICDKCRHIECIQLTFIAHAD